MSQDFCTVLYILIKKVATHIKHGKKLIIMRSAYVQITLVVKSSDFRQFFVHPGVCLQRRASVKLPHPPAVKFTLTVILI